MAAEPPCRDTDAPGRGPFLLLEPDPEHRRLVLAQVLTLCPHTHAERVREQGALTALRGLPGPIVIVSIVGPQRGGKSTLLNLVHPSGPSS